MIRFLTTLLLSLLMAAPLLITPVWAGEVSGLVRAANGQPAAGVTVRFWREGAPHKAIDTTTLSTGRYRLNLGDGIWHGAACDAPDGHTPLFWDATVENGRVTAFTAQNQRQPVITASSPVTLQPGVPVTLTGSGFGCAGKVEIDTSAIAPYTVTQFISRNDGQVVFTLPTLLLEKTTGGPGLIRYRHGHLVSPPLPFVFNGGGTP